MIITSNDDHGIVEFKEFFSKQFKMKNFCLFSYFLGFEVVINTIGYYVSRAKYATNLLFHAPLIDSKIVSIPIKTNATFTSYDRKLLLSDPSLYRQLVGNLVYLTITHFDVGYAIQIMS